MRKPNRWLSGGLAASPAQRLTREWKPSAPTIQRAGTMSPAIETPSGPMPLTGAPHNMRTPAAVAASTILECRTVRRTPSAYPSGKEDSTETPRSMNRMPRKDWPGGLSHLMPRLRNAAKPSGISPSPHALSIGGPAPAASVTFSPLRRAAMAAARPAGPPPMTNRSVGCISGRRLPSRSGSGSGPLTQAFQVLEALAQRVERIARGLVLFDEVVLHAGLLGGAQHRRDIHGAVAQIVKCGARDVLVEARLCASCDVLQVHQGNAIAVLLQNADRIDARHTRPHDVQFEADELRIGGLHQDIEQSAIRRGLVFESVIVIAEAHAGFIGQLAGVVERLAQLANHLDAAAVARLDPWADHIFEAVLLGVFQRCRQLLRLVDEKLLVEVHADGFQRGLFQAGPDVVEAIRGAFHLAITDLLDGAQGFERILGQDTADGVELHAHCWESAGVEGGGRGRGGGGQKRAAGNGAHVHML